jgi:hypothetical protein
VGVVQYPYNHGPLGGVRTTQVYELGTGSLDQFGGATGAARSTTTTSVAQPWSVEPAISVEIIVSAFMTVSSRGVRLVRQNEIRETSGPERA